MESLPTGLDSLEHGKVLAVYCWQEFQYHQEGVPTLQKATVVHILESWLLNWTLYQSLMSTKYLLHQTLLSAFGHFLNSFGVVLTALTVHRQQHVEESKRPSTHLEMSLSLFSISWDRIQLIDNTGAEGINELEGVWFKVGVGVESYIAECGAELHYHREQLGTFNLVQVNVAF